jgi:actin-related protein
MFPGLAERLEKEVARLALEGTTVRVIAPPNRNLAAWIGGSSLASLPTFAEQVVSRDEYFDTGPGIVNRKCF